MIVTFSMLAIVLAASAWVTDSVMRNVDKIGHLPEIKSTTISKALFNFYAVAVLCVVVVIRYLKFIETDGFVVLLSIVLSGLGFKFAAELKSERKNPPASPPDGTT
ncbi:MAG: hypothetical protein ACLQVN_05160 [Bryobacteraceae bacterium]